MDKLFTVAEAAERAGVSESLIYQLCEERRIAHFRPGGKGKRGKILICPRDLDALMESCRIRAAESPAVKPPVQKVAGAFQNLDAGRLQEAWRKQGALED